MHALFTQWYMINGWSLFPDKQQYFCWFVVFVVAEVQDGMCSQRSLTSAISIGNISEERQSIFHTLTERGKIWSSVFLVRYRYLTDLGWLTSLPPWLLCSSYQDEQEQIGGGWWHRHEWHRKISTSSSHCKSDLFFPFFSEIMLVFQTYCRLPC